MITLLDRILEWTERQLPESRSVWVSDLRSEAVHIQSGFARHRFLWSGALAAIGQVMRIRFGVQRVGQTLLGLALLSFCLYLIFYLSAVDDNAVRTIFYGLLPIYAAAGALTLLNLRWLKRYAVVCGLAFAALWLVSGMTFFTSMDVPLTFLRALLLEALFMMVILFIAASFLGWADRAEHA